LKVGLLFGSFNPIHIGHLALANYFAEYTDLEQVWFVVTPHNPLKPKASLLNDYKRLELVQIAVEDFPKFKASKIEFDLPQPNYTIHTLAHLKEKYPEHSFVLIMGEDNLDGLEKWKNYEVILDQYAIYVYPRPGVTTQKHKGHPHVKMVDAPVIEISSTFIRDAIKNKKDVRFFLPEKVWKYIDDYHLYEK
jgi:nicotinate-nucleotide adenylyltransferase